MSEGFLSRGFRGRRQKSDLSGRIRIFRAERKAVITELGNAPMSWLYVIVATGNIYEDFVQAQAAAR